MAKLRKEGGKVKRNVTKRGSYLDDECKVHKIVPGPGKYHFADEWPVKAHLKPKYPERITQIAEIMKSQKKGKIPSPGFYQLNRSLKQEEEERKKLSVRRVKLPDRINFLDEVQVMASQQPGVGHYNLRVRLN